MTIKNRKKWQHFLEQQRSDWKKREHYLKNSENSTFPSRLDSEIQCFYANDFSDDCLAFTAQQRKEERGEFLCCGGRVGFWYGKKSKLKFRNILSHAQWAGLNWRLNFLYYSKFYKRKHKSNAGGREFKFEHTETMLMHVEALQLAS